MDSDSFDDESPLSQQSYTHAQSDFESSQNEDAFRGAGSDVPDFDQFNIEDHSDSEPEQYSQDDLYLLALPVSETKFSDQTNLIMPEDGIQVVGTTATANIKGKVDLSNLIRTFKLLRLASSKKVGNNIPKKVKKGSKDKIGPQPPFKHSAPFRFHLKKFGIEGFASGNVFSNGKILLSSIKTDDDDLVKSILFEVAKHIEEAHCDSITNFCVPVVHGFPYDGRFSILQDRISISPQLQFCVPFRIKYSRLDNAFQNGQLHSVEHGLIAMSSKKENKSGHGYLVFYDSFSCTIYHTGKVQCRLSKSQLSRAQLKNALLRVYAILMSIQSIIEVQGDDSYDGSARRHPKNAAAPKQVQARAGPSPFKHK